ncbi:hypothetical protein J2X36_002070 [Methylobacterium sp. BE186]|uniref:aminoglycoside adenylyltransferase domain-containing protein n=1 Tax=Methylobacterium sp. BE186 TaxID=2817715 RepID=UPI002864186A|nr:aminoglycoside adenylyltransferase domain-containing protein [Methylobacterium sp. BE186]MDR7037323.1 hypothetical protein [Methylobacterium sp. BE186]
MRRTLDAYRVELSRAGTPRLDGLYFVGSVALGAYQAGQSDIDVLAVLAEPPDEAAIAGLASLHRAMAERGKPDLDAVYATLDRLRRPEQDALPTPFAVDGILHTDRRCNGLNAVLRQCLVEHGLVLFGPPVAALGIAADRDAERYVRDNLGTYWRPWIEAAAGTIAARRPDGDVDAAALSTGALGVARIAATIETGAIVSKSAAGHWALERFPGWDDVLAQREGRVARAGLDGGERVLAFMRLVVDRYAA